MRLGFFRFAGLSSLRRNADALAIHRNFAFRTERADWLAKILPVRNKQVVKHDPVAPWQFLSQCHLGVVRRLRLDISQPVGNPMNMRIDRNAGLPKRQRHDDVRCLATDTRQFQKLFQIRRHLAAEPIDQLFADAVNGSRFHSIKRNRIDRIADDSFGSGEHLLWCIRYRKQPLTCGTRRLVLSPKAENAGDQDGEWSLDVMTDCRQRPLPTFLAEDPNDVLDIFRSHQFRKTDLCVFRVVM